MNTNLTQPSSTPLTAHLGRLEASGLIRVARLEPEVEYSFRHALIQEAAYLSLVRTNRRRVHQAVGQALEQLYPDELASPELAPVLARHFAEAGDARGAHRYYALAGRAALQVYANAEAIEHFDRALEAARSLPDVRDTVVDLYLRRGRALELSAQDAEALRNYQALESWASARGDRPAQLAAVAAATTIYVKPSVEQNLPRGYALSQQALALAQELGDRAAEARVLWNLLLYSLGVGDNDAALDYGERALAIAGELGLREQRAYILTDLLKAYFQAGQADRGQAALHEAASIWRELGVLNMLADNLGSTSMLSTMAGHYEQALAHSDEAARVSRQIGNLWNQAYALYIVDIVHFERGDVARAIAAAEEAVRLGTQAGFSEGINQASFDLALIYGYMGAGQRAVETALNAKARAASVGGASAEWPQIDALIAYLHFLDGRLGEARAVLDASPLAHDPEALKQQFLLTHFMFGLVTAELALAEGQAEQALNLAAEICAGFRQTGVRPFLPDALWLQGRALRQAGRLEEAQAMLETSRREAAELGSRRIAWQILAEMASLAASRGDETAGLAYRQQAVEIIDYIAAHAGSAGLRESFLARPAVREVVEGTGRTGP